jgi:hypothetical protein
VTPAGELDIALLFPADTDAGQARLTGYIADGLTRLGSLTGTAADAATKLWAQYRAYLAKYQQALAEESTAAFVDAGSSSFYWQQIAGWKELADQKLAEFEAAVGDVAAVTSRAIPAPNSVALDFSW